VCDGVGLKPENEIPSKSSTLPMAVVVVFFSVVSSLVSKEFPASMLAVFLAAVCVAVCVATAATAVFISF